VPSILHIGPAEDIAGFCSGTDVGPVATDNACRWFIVRIYVHCMFGHHVWSRASRHNWSSPEMQCTRDLTQPANVCFGQIPISGESCHRDRAPGPRMHVPVKHEAGCWQWKSECVRSSSGADVRLWVRPSLRRKFVSRMQHNHQILRSLRVCEVW